MKTTHLKSNGLCALLPLALASLLALLPGCGDDDDEAGSVSVLFDHTVAGRDLVFDEADYTNEAGNQYQVTRLEYILTDVALLQADGRRFQLAPQHYRNARLSSTRRLEADKVPGATYTALSFIFGVAGPGDQTGRLPNIAAFNNMVWPEAMGGGYHYMKLEGNYQTSDTEGAFLLHLGPSGGGDFSISVELPLNLEVNGDDWDIHVVVDLAEWLTNPNTYDFAGRGGIMGDEALQAILQQNGATVFTVGPITPHVRDRDDDEEIEEEDPDDRSG